MGTLPPILVPTDLSDASEHALTWALSWAGGRSQPVHLLHVVDFLRTEVPASVADAADVAELWTRLNTAYTEELDRLVARYEQRGDLRVEQRRGSDVVETIVATAKEVGAGLVVMGTHGRRGVGKLLLGSIAEEVVRAAPCDVVVIHAHDVTRRAIERVLVPLDFAPRSPVLLGRAIALAKRFGAHLDLLHVFNETALPILWPGPGVVENVLPKLRRRAEEQLGELRAIAEAEGVRVETHIESGHVAQRIVTFAEEHGADLVMMGSHGHSGLNRFLIGSTTERLLPLAPCPVYVHRIRSDEEKAAPLEATASSA